MRSGVGPAAHLRSHGIAVRLDLPGVGANLADHAGVDIDCGYRGPARTAPIFHLLATFRSSATPSDQAPDLMLWLFDPRGDPPVFEIDVGLLRPRSRGAVRLRSPHPAEPPRIDLPGKRDPFDVGRLAEAYRRGLEVASRPEIRRLCAEPPAPRPLSTSELPDLIRAKGYSLPHVAGTCAMGPHPDDGAVVETSERVYGTGRLSVIYASVIPNGPSAFTHIPTRDARRAPLRTARLGNLTSGPGLPGSALRAGFIGNRRPSERRSRYQAHGSRRRHPPPARNWPTPPRCQPAPCGAGTVRP